MSQGVCFCLDPFFRIEGVLIRGQWRRGRESLAVVAGDRESRSVCLEGDCVCVECIHGVVSVYACGMCVCERESDRGTTKQKREWAQAKIAHKR